MLDTETKRRIDTARDILVGKVPDPKSQVEQITIALIYKFMDDMDAEAEELGGERKFFNGEFAKYGWAKLMSPAMGGHEVLNLYGEAITKMTENEGIPALFRDIFKNAYLPYRDPETLKSFLKIINDFEYDHSERLGDAFEYLLSVLGAQGDAGQFRTPRHIIEFMVQVIDPKKDETVLDPACGTAGFLISSYKHILKANSKNNRAGAALNPDERKTLTGNIKGYDISPDMVRLSLVNLYLHGFTDPHIAEYDTLTSEDNWNEYADIILANPPFMSPKGGIKPHKRFSITAKRSEVLFVDYIAEHLAPNGRAAVIVPEGIIFQSQNAYKQLREMLVKNYLFAVVSLPAGVFKPYSGVKTSILLMDKALAKRCDSLLFVKVENDGFDLGAQRRKIDKNDLPEAITALQDFQQSCLTGEEFNADLYSNVLKVEKEKIGENGEWNLSGERYRENDELRVGNYELVELGEVCKYAGGTQPPKSTFIYEKREGYIRLLQIRDYKSDKNAAYIPITERHKTCTVQDIMIGRYGPPVFQILRGKAGAYNVALMKCIPDNKKLSNDWLYYLLSFDSVQETIIGLSARVRQSGVRPDDLNRLQIPLPPLKIQQEIVAEIEGYQKIIDGARSVVNNYKPQIQINPDWEMVELGEVCKLMTGSTPKTTIKEYYENGDIKWLVSGDIHKGQIFDCKKRITKKGMENSNLKWLPINSVLIALNGQGKTRGTVAILRTEATCNQSLVSIEPVAKNLIAEFIYYQLQSKYQEIRNITGDEQRSGLNMPIIRQIKFPLPPLETQKEIVRQIENEQSLVNANKELITLFEQKIKDKIASVWGES